MIKLETGMHVKAVLFIIAKSGNKPNIHQLDNVKTKCSIVIYLKYYSAVKRNGVLVYAMKCTCEAIIPLKGAR